MQNGDFPKARKSSILTTLADWELQLAKNYDGARDFAVYAARVADLPGTVWDYENYDTLLGVLALKTALEDEQTYLEFPRQELFDKIGWIVPLPSSLTSNPPAISIR